MQRCFCVAMQSPVKVRYAVYIDAKQLLALRGIGKALEIGRHSARVMFHPIVGIRVDNGLSDRIAADNTFATNN